MPTMGTSLRYRSLLPGIIVALWIMTGPLNGQERRLSAVDHYGDPLPEGAVARLGTLRFVHVGHLTSVALSPDGKVVASGVRDGNDIDLGQKIVRKLDGSTYTERIRVTQSAIRLWDAASGKLIREISTPDAPVSSLLFGPAGKTLFAGCGRFLCTWDVSTGKKLWEQEAVKVGRFHNGILAEMILLARDRLISVHDGNLICPVRRDRASSTYYHSQKVIRIWDSKSGKPLETPRVLESTLHAENRIAVLFHEIAVSPDGKYAAVLVSGADPNLEEDRTGSREPWKYTNRRLQIIELDTGKVAHTVSDAKGTLRGLTFADDGQVLVVAAGKEIWLMRPATGEKTPLAGASALRVRRLKFVEKTQLAMRLEDNTIQVWDIATGKRIDPLPGRECQFEEATNGRVAATRCDNAVCLIDLATGKPMHSFDAHRWKPAVRYALHSSDILLSRDPKQAYLWDTRSWTVKEALVPPVEQSYYSLWLHHDAGMDHGAAVEKHLYVKQTGKGLELRDIKADRLIRSLEASAGETEATYFSAAGNRLVKHEEKWSHFFDVDTGKHLSRVPRAEVNWWGFNCSELLSPRGKYFAKNETHGEVGVFDVESGKQVGKLRPPISMPPPEKRRFHSILWFRFSEDDRALLGEVHEELQEDGFFGETITVLLWDISSGKVVRETVIAPRLRVFWAQALQDPVITSLALSHDRRLVALTQKEGKTIEIWDVAAGTRRGVLSGHDGSVVDLAFSADDRQLASSSEDTTILVWDLNRPLQPGTFPDRLGEKVLAAHWQTLFQPDATAADKAIWGLVYAARDSVPFLKKHLRPAIRPDGKRVDLLLSNLGSADFKTRRDADAELESYGELILTKLDEAFKQPTIPEKRRRLEGLLHKAQLAALPYGSPDRVGQLHALEVLEKIGSREAKQLLRELADGAPDARLTIAARESLSRVEPSRR
jgi:WD40 repeat protein